MGVRGHMRDRSRENEVHGRKPGRTELECTVCGKFYRSDRFANHMNRAHKNLTSNLTSIEQGNPALELLHQHRPMMPRKEMSAESTPSSKRRKGNSARKCMQCNKGFNGAGDFWKHMEIHKPGKGKPWKCTSCPAFFAQGRNLRMHEKEIHRKNLGAFECPTCGKTFSTTFSAKYHMRTVHGDKKPCSAVIIEVDQHQQTYKSERVNGLSWQKLLSQLRPCNLVLDRCDHLIPNYSKRACSKENGMGTDSGSIENDNGDEGNEGERKVAPRLWEAEQNDNQMVLEESSDSVSYADENTENDMISYSSDDDHPSTDMVGEEAARRSPSKSPDKSNASYRIRKMKGVGNRMWSYEKKQLGRPRDLSAQRKIFNGRSRVATKLHTAPRKIELFKCPFCPETFLGTDGLIKHLNTHKDPQQSESNPPSPNNNPKIQAFSKISDRMKKISSDNCYFPNKRKPHECPQCGFHFRDQQQLRRRHMRLHSEVGRPWNCDDCRCCFTNKNQLRLHEGKRHGKKYQYQASTCAICNILLDTESGYKRHMRIHEETSRPYKCSNCPSFFLYLSSLRKHEFHVHGIKAARMDSKISCGICGKAAFYYGLKKHMRIHTETDRPFKCSECVSFFNSATSLRLHENVSHERKPGTTKLPCNVCGKHVIACKLARHMQIHKWGSNKLWKCSQCPSYFIQGVNLKNHIKDVHGENEQAANEARVSEVEGSASEQEVTSSWQHNILRQLQPCTLVLDRCDHLLSKFTKPESPKKTQGQCEKSRENKKPLTRGSTGARSQSNKSLDAIPTGNTEPEVKTSSIPTQRMYTCPYCFDSFVNPGLLIAHLPTHTTEKNAGSSEEQATPIKAEKQIKKELSPTTVGTSEESLKMSSDKKFKCSQCNFSCLADKTLQNHMKLHSKEGRPFQCSLCACCFPTFKSLRNHVGRFHKGSKQLNPSAQEHKCQQCNYSSKTLSDLKAHMKLHCDKGGLFKCPLCSYTVGTTRGLSLHGIRVHKGFNNRSHGHPSTSKLR